MKRNDSNYRLNDSTRILIRIYVQSFLLCHRARPHHSYVPIQFIHSFIVSYVCTYKQQITNNNNEFVPSFFIIHTFIIFTSFLIQHLFSFHIHSSIRSFILSKDFSFFLYFGEIRFTFLLQSFLCVCLFPLHRSFKIHRELVRKHDVNLFTTMIIMMMMIIIVVVVVVIYIIM